jgi:T-complex protein 1 subunit theta
MSKQYGKEDFITDLVCQACISILPKNTLENKKSFNVDNIRICKILGSGLHSSQV